MDILRLPPYPLSVDIEVPLPNHTYSVIIDGEPESHVSDVDSLISLELDGDFVKYDAEYHLVVKDGDDIVVEDNLAIVRPYIDVAKVYKDVDLAAYAEYERIARLAIDNIVGGFYYKKATIERMGTGSDVLPLGYPIRKILTVNENGEAVYDGNDNAYEYVLSDNSLYMKVASSEDIIEGSPIKIPTGSSDTFTNMYYGVQFGPDYVYTITAEVGYPVVPSDIQACVKRMIDQLACGTPNYLQKYVIKYETAEFRTDFDRRAFAGTGDLLVDQTLKRYWSKNLFHTVGVL